MNDIKSNIENKEIIYNIKPKDIFDSSIRKTFKRRSDEEHENKEIKENDNHISIKNDLMPKFTNLKSEIYRNLNKSMPKDIENLEELKEESDYYQILNGQVFLMNKKYHMLIFMSPMQANLLYENNHHVFIEGTFYSAPKCCYQIVTIRIHNIKEDLFNKVAYGILIDKSLNS